MAGILTETIMAKSATRKNAIFKKSVDGEGFAQVHTWEAIEGGRKTVIDGSKIPEKTRFQIFGHGINAKVGDAGAIQNATTDEKQDAMEKVIAALYAGEWRGERESTDAILLDALCKFNPKQTREKHGEELKALSSAEKLTLRTIPAIKKIYDSLVAETVKKSGASDKDLLAKFAAAAE